MLSLLEYKRIYIGILALAVLLASIYVAIQHKDLVDSPTEFFDETLSTANGVKVRLVYPDSPEKGVILFLADHADANNTLDYAKQFAELSYYVVVLDSNELLSSTTDGSSQCINIVQRLLDIQNSLRQKLDSDPQLLPIIIGNNEGAALVYTALAQAKDHSFHAAISINFSGQLHNTADLCSAEEFIQPMPTEPRAWRQSHTYPQPGTCFRRTKQFQRRQSTSLRIRLPTRD